MAYIDFYNYVGEKKRLILGHVDYQVDNIHFNVGDTIFFTVDKMRFNEQGSDVSELFNVDKLDWTNPPQIWNGSKGYRWDSNNNISIFIHKSKIVTLHGKGQISGTTIETKYNYDGGLYRITLLLNNKASTGIQFLSPKASLSGNGDDLPINSSGFISQYASNRGALFFSKVVYQGKEYNCYMFNDISVKKAETIYSGRNVGTGYGAYTQAYARGCIYTVSGVLINSWIGSRPCNIGNGWEDIAPTYQIKARGQVVSQEFRTAYISDLLFFSADESVKPDNDKPDKYPDQPQNPDEPTDEPTGGDGDGDKKSDKISDGDTVTPISPTGLITIYKINEQMINQLGKELWSENFLNGILKITQNPIDTIIQLKAMYVNFPTISNTNIMLGNYKTTLLSDTVSSFQKIDFGEIKINRFFGDFKDYNPYTKISIYLPFIGVKDLSVQEIMNTTIKLIYNVDVISGDCVAMITVIGEIDGTKLDSVLYQFDGNMNIEIPISQASANTMIYARLSQLQQISNAVMRINGNGGKNMNEYDKAGTIINSGINIMKSEIEANHLDVNRTGSLGTSKGMLSIKTPYIIIERPLPSYPTSYAHNMGIPTNKTIKLSNIKGFTQILEIFISNFTGTQNEYNELITLLRQGVVF